MVAPTFEDKYTGLEKRKVSQSVSGTAPIPPLSGERGPVWPRPGLAQQDVSIRGSAGPLSSLHIL